MKHSLTASPGRVPALFDLLAAGLSGGTLDRPTPTRAARPAPERRSWLDRLEHALWSSRQRELERYLASSVDIVDLEDRLRRLERRSFHRYD
jgi:Protein of unknown function (DUF3563)